MSLILVIDQQSVYRSGIRELIEESVCRARVVEASGFEDFEDVTAGRFFDLILVDAGCLSPRLLEYFKEWHELSSETRFAVMSSSGTRSDVLSCLSAGFHGFVHKLQSDQDLIIAVNDLLSGRIYVPRWFADGDCERTGLSSSTNLDFVSPKLTRRQNEILPMIAQGMSNKEISLHLHIAEGTTKIHTAALLHALGARNRTEAAFIAARLVRSGDRVEDRLGNQRFVTERLTGATRRLRSAS